ncbi:hypothetical protein ALC57_10971 [Trachymyrmex cornetzi]|uniref:Uncharacterized protein n=1 Tax=Trachymyrmex cornetzi TaxID=471704 RepID=A0A195DW37_9HYME|nr:hypothetical protein ALC57_10971 [Trachymyrmex cornetzi]
MRQTPRESSAQRVNGSSRLATALSASSRSFLLMLVGQRGSYDYGRSVPHRELSWSGELCHPPTTPTPWSSRSPGSLPPPNVVPPRRQLPLVLPPSVPIVQARRRDETTVDAMTNVECIAKSSVSLFKRLSFLKSNEGNIFGINDNFICLIENICGDMVFALDLEENIVARIHVKLDGAFNSLAAVPRTATALLGDQWMLRHYTAAFAMAPMPLFQNEISLYRKCCRRMFFRIGAA